MTSKLRETTIINQHSEQCKLRSNANCLMIMISLTLCILYCFAMSSFYNAQFGAIVNDMMYIRSSCDRVVNSGLTESTSKPNAVNLFTPS